MGVIFEQGLYSSGGYTRGFTVHTMLIEYSGKSFWESQSIFAVQKPIETGGFFFYTSKNPMSIGLIDLWLVYSRSACIYGRSMLDLIRFMVDDDG